MNNRDAISLPATLCGLLLSVILCFGVYGVVRGFVLMAEMMGWLR